MKKNNSYKEVQKWCCCCCRCCVLELLLLVYWLVSSFRWFFGLIYTLFRLCSHNNTYFFWKCKKIKNKMKIKRKRKLNKLKLNDEEMNRKMNKKINKLYILHEYMYVRWWDEELYLLSTESVSVSRSRVEVETRGKINIK